MNDKTRFAKCYLMIIEHLRLYVANFVDGRIIPYKSIKEYVEFAFQGKKNKKYKTTLYERYLNEVEDKDLSSADLDISALHLIVFANEYIFKDNDGRTPGLTGNSPGNLIQRINDTRNTFSHSTEARLSKDYYNFYLQDFKNIASYFEVINNVANGSYVAKLEEIDRKPMNGEEVDYIMKGYAAYCTIVINRQISSMGLETDQAKDLKKQAVDVQQKLDDLQIQHTNLEEEAEDLKIQATNVQQQKEDLLNLNTNLAHQLKGLQTENTDLQNQIERLERLQREKTKLCLICEPHGHCVHNYCQEASHIHNQRQSCIVS